MLMITGSPMWTDYSVMDRFETGRVYVVYQDKQVSQSQSQSSLSSVLVIIISQHRFRNFDTLSGEGHKARFGISVASLGDINLDGFQGMYHHSPINQNHNF